MSFSRVRSVATVVVCLALLAAPAAAGTPFTIDKVHSSVTFSVRHFFTNVKGSFNEFDGAIDYDDKNPAASRVEFTVQAASIDTANPKRDEHLRSADFFDAQKHPSLTFKSEKVTARSPVELEVTGPLTIHGVTKTVTVPVKVLGVMDLKERGLKAGFEATFKVDRKEFGIVWNRALDNGAVVLGDEVTVTVAIEADGPKPAPAAAPPAAATS